MCKKELIEHFIRLQLRLHRIILAQYLALGQPINSNKTSLINPAELLKCSRLQMPQKMRVRVQNKIEGTG